MQHSGYIFKDSLIVSAPFGLRCKTDASNEANTRFPFFFPYVFYLLKSLMAIITEK